MTSETSRPVLPGDADSVLARGEWLPWIAGRASSRDGRKLLPVLDPATDRELGIVHLADEEDVDAAVVAATRAFDTWSETPGRERARLLWAWADVIERHAYELAALDVLENGMPARQSLAYVRWAADTLRETSGWAAKLTGLTSDQGPGLFAHTLRVPVGVVGTICPWNAPAAGFLRQVTPALTAGCTVVGKPSELTPFTALRVAELAAEAGMPPGVLNVVPGVGSVAGEHLARHDGVARINFTGSTATGRRIVEASATNMKRMTLELGGKSPDIIFDDADLSAAVVGAAAGIFTNAGQVCVAGSRLFVQAGCYDEVVDRLQQEARRFTVGPGFEPASDVGPLISTSQRLRVQGHVDGAVEDGATVVLGGRSADADWNVNENFYQPTIIADVTPEMRIAREEVFGPEVNVVRFGDEEEVLALANGTDFGLAGGLWTQNLSRAHRFTRRIRAGMLWVNCYGAWATSLPHTGQKQSGYGAKYGFQAVAEHTEERTVLMNL